MRSRCSSCAPSQSERNLSAVQSLEPPSTATMSPVIQRASSETQERDDRSHVGGRADPLEALHSHDDGAAALRIIGISYVYIDAFNRNARLTRALSRNCDLLVAGIGTSSRQKFSGVGGLCAETRDQSVSPWAHSCFLPDGVLGDDRFLSRGTALARCASPWPKEKFSPGAS